MSTVTHPVDLTPAQAREALAAAEKEKREAQGLADALAERARDGDPDVTPAKLAEARQLADFAQLRITAAERKLAAAEAADRHARADQLAAEARDLVDEDDLQALADGVRKVAEATAALYEVAITRNDRIRAVNAIARTLEGEFEQAGQPGELSRGHGVVRHPEGVIVGRHGQAMLLGAAELLAAAVRLADGPQVTEGELIEAFNGPDGTLGRVLKAVPSLAEEWRHSPEKWAQMSRRQQSHAVATRRAPQPHSTPA